MPFKSFANHAAYYGADAFNAFKGTNTPMAALIDLAGKEEAQIITPIATETWPSGTMHAEAYKRNTGAICDAVVSGCDAVFLYLHSAMVSRISDDGEGTLLECIRSIAPKMPIAVVLDLHANITNKMISIPRTSIGWIFPGAAELVAEAIVLMIEVKNNQGFSRIPGLIGYVFPGIGQPSLIFFFTPWWFIHRLSIVIRKKGEKISPFC